MANALPTGVHEAESLTTSLWTKAIGHGPAACSMITHGQHVFKITKYVVGVILTDMESIETRQLPDE